ncbi:putative phage tail protein [Halobacillus litoralis]|uniref:Uncharacterized protein n=1 Tax=Halobacillus litoralis TaxID=45668 RepID=A0A410MCG3_9BACI|nr:putative phage tail protein [Halobacillus litoralis]QAS52368.1 hypothetical protein HLI_09050 [Halobacillus litoralis]
MIFVDESIPVGERLFNSLPDLYERSDIMRMLMDIRGDELGKIQDILDEILLQFSINTATWTIEWWEKEYGVNASYKNSLEERRSVVKAKMRKGDASHNILLKRVVDAYTNGQVETRFENGIIIVAFTSFYGVPSNLDDVRESVLRIIPAHLPFEFEFRYYFIDEVEKLTINEMEASTLDAFSF